MEIKPLSLIKRIRVSAIIDRRLNASVMASAGLYSNCKRQYIILMDFAYQRVKLIHKKLSHLFSLYKYLFNAKINTEI
jgi:hypothetical protein